MNDMARKKFVAGNWKMNRDGAETADLLKGIIEALKDRSGRAEIAVCPPFTSIAAAKAVLEGSGILLGAQDASEHDDGAYTGEVSVRMLRAAGCTHVILGHSERRQYHGESDGLINRKLRKALSGGLVPVVCVGETLSERETGRTTARITSQIHGVLEGLAAADAAGLIIAYEPVWAIGTGKTATPAEADEVHRTIRGLLSVKFGEKTAQAIRILYGGSVNEGNAAELFGRPDIDGGLIGGASLKPGPFVTICNAAG
jgi:triosephosphate isomerase